MLGWRTTLGSERGELEALRLEVERLRGVGASASRSFRARNDDGDAIRTLLTISTSRIQDDAAGSRLTDWANGRLENTNARRLHDWLTTGRLVLQSRGAVVCTLNPLTLVSSTTHTLMIHNATAAGNVAVLRVLLEVARFPPNARDAMGRTALHHLAFTPAAWQLATARLLLQFGADPSAADFAGATPQDWLGAPTTAVHRELLQLLYTALRGDDADRSVPRQTSNGNMSAMLVVDRHIPAATASRVSAGSVDGGPGLFSPPGSNPSSAFPSTARRLQLFENEQRTGALNSAAMSVPVDSDTHTSDTGEYARHPVEIVSNARALSPSVVTFSSLVHSTLPILGPVETPAGSSWAELHAPVSPLPPTVSLDIASRLVRERKVQEDIVAVQTDAAAVAVVTRALHAVTLTGEPRAEGSNVVDRRTRLGLESVTFASPPAALPFAPRDGGVGRGVGISHAVRRVGAWYVLLLIDRRPPWQLQSATTASADEAVSDPIFGDGAAMRGRMPPRFVARRVEVLENGPKANGQERSVQLSQDPKTGYAVAAAVGPIVVEGYTWAAMNAEGGIAVVRGASTADQDARAVRPLAGAVGEVPPARIVSRRVATVACAMIAATARERARRAAVARLCLANCDEERARPANATSLVTATDEHMQHNAIDAAAAAVDGRAFRVRDVEAELRVVCPHRSSIGDCEYSAYRALVEAVTLRDALNAASADDGGVRLRSRVSGSTAVPLSVVGSPTSTATRASAAMLSPPSTPHIARGGGGGGASATAAGSVLGGTLFSPGMEGLARVGDASDENEEQTTSDVLSVLRSLFALKPSDVLHTYFKWLRDRSRLEGGAPDEPASVFSAEATRDGPEASATTASATTPQQAEASSRLTAAVQQPQLHPMVASVASLTTVAPPYIGRGSPMRSRVWALRRD